MPTSEVRDIRFCHFVPKFFKMSRGTNGIWNCLAGLFSEHLNSLEGSEGSIAGRKSNWGKREDKSSHRQNIARYFRMKKEVLGNMSY